jgi:hypothetical protein
MSEYQIIDVDEVPTEEKWKIKPIYSLDAKGKLRIWEIGFDGENLFSEYGQVDGKKIVAQIDVPPNSRGKTLQEKALLKARGKYNPKFREKGNLADEEIAEIISFSSKSSPKAIPAVSPKNLPVASPKNLPVASPKNLPAVPPKDIPVASPKILPAVPPKDIPVASPKNLPVASPKNLPSVPPKDIPVASPKSLPVASPKISPKTSSKKDKETCAVKPMLSNEFAPYKVIDAKAKADKNYTLKWRALTQFPVVIQPKLDGVRSVVDSKGDEIGYCSRGSIRRTHFTHISEQLKIFLKYLPPNTLLDGELYDKELSLQEITGIVSAWKNLSVDLPKLKYYIFDIVVDNLPFEDRMGVLLDAYESYIKDGNVNTAFFILKFDIVYNWDQILGYRTMYIDMGYEGIMIRKVAGKNPTPEILQSSYYEHRRTDNMLKYKLRQTDEGITIDINEGTGTEKGAAVFQVKTKTGHIFDVRPKGSFEQRREWFINKDFYIGKPFTYSYLTLTNEGNPREPIGIGPRLDD